MVRKERPDLEETKDQLVRGIAAGKKRLLDLENEILRYSICLGCWLLWRLMPLMTANYTFVFTHLAQVGTPVL